MLAMEINLCWLILFNIQGQWVLFNNLRIASINLNYSNFGKIYNS